MWLLPTLNRTEKLKNLFEASIKTEVSTPCLVIVDHKDWEENKDKYEALALPKSWEYRQTASRTMGDKIREVWPEVVRRGRKWVGVLNDDHHPMTNKWDRVLLEMLDGKNFTSANDRSPRTFLMPVTATAWSMDLLKAIEWPIYPPGLTHLFIDDVWRDLGRACGCWRIETRAVVMHNHVLFGTGVKDETHNVVYGEEFPQKSSRMWDHDKAIYENFMKHDFPQTVEKIKRFQNHIQGQRFSPDYATTSDYYNELDEG